MRTGAPATRIVRTARTGNGDIEVPAVSILIPAASTGCGLRCRSSRHDNSRIVHLSIFFGVKWQESDINPEITRANALILPPSLGGDQRQHTGSPAGHDQIDGTHGLVPRSGREGLRRGTLRWAIGRGETSDEQESSMTTNRDEQQAGTDAQKPEGSGIWAFCRWFLTRAV